MKAPAFQLYAADFYMDTVGWTPMEVGVYFRLLMHEWINGPLPNNMPSLSRIAGISDPRTLHKMWSRTLGKKFTETDGNSLINKRLEIEREKQANYKESQRERAIKRWVSRDKKSDAVALPAHMPEACSSSSSSYKKEKNIKKEKIEYSENRFTTIPSALMNKWREVAPGISIPDEIKKAELWLIAHPEKRRKRWDAFLSNWMVRAQENFIRRGNGRSGGPVYNDKRQTLQERQKLNDEHADELARKWWAAQEASGGDTAGVSPPDDVPDFPVP